MTGRELRLISAGAAAVGTAFGLARYGYGLLLPDIRAELRLGTPALGAIGTGSYAAYLAATAAVSVLAQRVGPRVAVGVGLALAALGMVLVATAGGPASLAAGVAVAGASSGLVFPPLSDAVAAGVRPRQRGRGLSIISSGTGWGVALAVAVAVVAGSDWRAAWLAFAAIAVAVLAFVVPSVPGRTRSSHDGPALRWSWLVCPRSGPLLTGALLVGLGASVFWTFAVDHAVSAGGLDAGSARLLLVAVGIASLAGSLAGDLVRRVGARPALVGSVVALAAALALMAQLPGSVPALVASALLFGASYNAVLAIQAIWSAKVFADRPSAGLAAVMFTLGMGLLLGPVAAGVLAGPIGLGGTFAAAAAVVLGAAALLPREAIAPAPEPEAGLPCRA